MPALTDVRVTIAPRANSQGHPFTEIFYDYQEGGAARRALTRVWFVMADTAHQRAAECEAFLRRREANARPK